VSTKELYAFKMIQKTYAAYVEPHTHTHTHTHTLTHTHTHSHTLTHTDKKAVGNDSQTEVDVYGQPCKPQGRKIP